MSPRSGATTVFARGMVSFILTASGTPWVRASLLSSYKNGKADDPSRGSVSANCQPVQNVQCKCHSRYNFEKHDCSNICD
ncbi:hypothetical protein CKAH01_18647 [Colletotrichum kahawae]|uniref:Uncharacterized protein n=1 Tax=Colletotrichum kahawae TaxID=34407 RepID=A0AAE0D212_COLKA|nr:hypothetical protein CKAH01_18647 [Colletotrichum kahawae]